jgi:hypothetical protein
MNTFRRTVFTLVWNTSVNLCSLLKTHKLESGLLIGLGGLAGGGASYYSGPSVDELYPGTTIRGTDFYKFRGSYKYKYVISPKKLSCCVPYSEYTTCECGDNDLILTSRTSSFAEDIFKIACIHPDSKIMKRDNKLYIDSVVIYNDETCLTLSNEEKE